MGKLRGNFLIGKIRDLIFKEVRGVQLVTSKVERGKMKQTVATKIAAGTFALASKLSCNFREAMRNELRVANDGTIHSRLTKVLLAILTQCRDKASNNYSFNEDSFNDLIDFNFNTSVSLAHKLPGKLKTVLNNGVLHVKYADNQPSRNLRFVKGSTACKLTFGMVLFRLSNSQVGRDYVFQSVMIKKSAPELRDLEFSFEVPNDCLYLLTATLNYYKGSVPIMDTKLNSGAIYDAVVVKGEYDESRKFRWLENELVFK